VKEARRKLLWTLEVLFLFLFMVVGTMPALDHSRRETLAYVKEPTQQNLDAVRAKKDEEIRTRWLYASPFGVVAVLLATPPFLKSKQTSSNR
jgi:hypothetical protein